MRGMEQDGWRRVRLGRLGALLHAPPARRWRWELVWVAKTIEQRLVSPRGVKWVFRLRHGAWIRPLAAGEGKRQKAKG